jgi:hypothetical protein
MSTVSKETEVYSTGIASYPFVEGENHDVPYANQLRGIGYIITGRARREQALQAQENLNRHLRHVGPDATMRPLIGMIEYHLEDRRADISDYVVLVRGSERGLVYYAALIGGRSAIYLADDAGSIRPIFDDNAPRTKVFSLDRTFNGFFILASPGVEQGTLFSEIVYNYSRSSLRAINDRGLIARAEDIASVSRVPIERKLDSTVVTIANRTRPINFPLKG